LRIHLGHHFYGAGNLGDDFMLAGFLTAMRRLAPDATYTCCVPFPLPPLRARFPEVEWLPCETAARDRSIAACDAWLGLGGSPFQHALSRWFLDHLLGEAAVCARHDKPMYYLGIGVQSPDELAAPEVRGLCAQAAGIWTRDPAAAEQIAALASAPAVAPAADLAHVYFRHSAPPHAVAGRVTVVPNFDYGSWPGQAALLAAVERLGATGRVWLAQEARELPGAERALHAQLPPAAQAKWRLVVPDERSGDFPVADHRAGSPRSRESQPAQTPPCPPTARKVEPAAATAEPRPLDAALSRWPSGEWLVTARYHAALAGAWAGSKIVVMATNEKLRAAARELGCPSIPPDADEATIAQALAAARPAAPPTAQAGLAFAACQSLCQRFLPLAEN
jgi:hypothetical protein